MSNQIAEVPQWLVNVVAKDSARDSGEVQRERARRQALVRRRCMEVMGVQLDIEEVKT